MTYPDHFARVDDRVWRGARPTPMQIAQLLRDGVKSVLNLEWEQSDPITDWAPATLLYRVPDLELLPSTLPRLADDHVIRCLRIIRNADPVMYVHCRSGENRTGVIIAAYRIVERNDPMEVVVEEFTRLGGIWQVPDMPYIRSIAARREFFLASI